MQGIGAIQLTYRAARNRAALIRSIPRVLLASIFAAPGKMVELADKIDRDNSRLRNSAPCPVLATHYLLLGGRCGANYS
jgi:hypothetical protein